MSAINDKWWTFLFSSQFCGVDMFMTLYGYCFSSYTVLIPEADRSRRVSLLQSTAEFFFYCRIFMSWFVLNVNWFFFYFSYNWVTTFKSLFKESHAWIIIMKTCLQAVTYKICLYEFKRTCRGTHGSCCPLSILRLEIPGLWWLGEGL